MTGERAVPFSVKELAAEVKLSEVHIRRLLTAGEIAGMMVGKTWIIPVDEAQRFIRERRARWEKF